MGSPLFFIIDRYPNGFVAFVFIFLGLILCFLALDFSEQLTRADNNEELGIFICCTLMLFLPGVSFIAWAIQIIKEKEKRLFK